MSATAYRRDIDGLRGLAIFAVVLFHAFPSLLSGGFVGVDVFFVISGYLITTIILRDLADKKFSFGQFYARRIRRIFPALIVVLATIWAAGWVILFPEEYSELGRHVGASSLFISNFVLWYEAGYFDRAAELKPLLHLWSLAVEEQFYLALPPLLLLFYRRRLWLVLALLFFASLLANLLLIHNFPEATFYMLHTRFWQLLLGSIIAYGAHQSIRVTRHTSVISLAGTALLALAMVGFNSEAHYPGWRAIVPTLGAALVIMAGDTHGLNRFMYGARPFVMLGLISYPLYLWHWPLLTYARLLHSGEPAVAVRIAAIAIAVVLAWATYRYIEQPIRFGRYKQSRTMIRNLLLILFAIGCVGGLTWHFKGFKSHRNFDVAMMADTEKLDTFRALQKPCDYPFAKDISWCLVSGNSNPSIVIYGDSHADHLFPGVVDDTSRSWLLIGASSCPPAEGLGVRYMDKPDICIEKNKRILSALIASPHIKTVVLAERGMAYIGKKSLIPNAKKHNNPNNWHVESTYVEESGLSKEELYQKGMSRTIAALEKAGKNVVVFMDIPELNFSPIRCMPRPISLLAPSNLNACATPKNEALEHAKPYHALLRRLMKAHPNVRFYDPTPQFCDDSRCYAGNETMLFYHDPNHLSQRGSKKVMADFMQWLEK